MKKLVLISLICASLHAQTNDVLQGVSFFSPRSQSVNALQAHVGWHPYIHRYENDDWYIATQLQPEVRASFRRDRIAQALFGTDTLYVSGSQTLNRNDNAILADYFGLSPEFQSEVVLSPKITNVLFTLNSFISFDRWVRGLYLTILAPIVWTRWNFDMKETIFSTGSTAEFPARYMADDAVAAPVTSFVQALKGDHTFGQMTEKMAFGKVCGPRTKWGLSDLTIALGYDILSREHGYAGVNLRLAAPTGNRPKATYFFEPLIGNGKHWELGLGFSGRVLIWEKDGEQECSFFADANFSHLFKAEQKRTFDFCANGFGSRYILLKKFDRTGTYTGKLIPALNRTTLCCDVSVDLQFELLAMFGYNYKGFVFDAGYNAWIRTHEKISLNECIADRTYGLKGIQNVLTGAQLASDVTQSTATLHGNLLTEQALVADTDSPAFISTNDLDLSSAASPMVLTHKLFAHIGYGADPYETRSWTPYIGAGSSVEFEGVNTSVTQKPLRNTLSQWAFWIQLGCIFG